ncbi:MAG: RNA 2',3'-cyclic phosphodiesterase [Deltaproteobacteria bacterium]|nr:RNA 2',3'-cyclic phosphodiesterase [Deltaproteobacteria bacterium]
MALIRTFVACNLPVKLVEALRGYQLRLRDSLEGWRPGIRWTSPASFHMTLRFLGEIEEPLVAALGDALRRAAAGHRAFDYTLQAVGCFPTAQRARVIWAGAESEELGWLAASVEREVQQIGLPPEEKPFHPHVTLGRLKSPLNLSGALSKVPLYPPTTVKVEEVVIYRSLLSPDGAVYDALQCIPLVARATAEEES